jgi:nicotinamide-nucleotide amidase
VKASLIAVGSELLRHGRRDTNGDWLAEQLTLAGVEVSARSAVEDDVDAIASCVRAAVRRDGLVVVFGGLGPTEDDRTREGLARALDLPLERDESRLESLRALFASRSREFRPLQARQADRPVGAAWVENPLGTAPGLLLEHRGARLFALPGVPAEMKAMVRSAVLPLLESVGEPARAVRTLKVAGRTESSVDEQLADLYDAPGVEVTILCGGEGIELHLEASGAEPGEARRRLGAVEGEMVRRLGDDLYDRGGGGSLARVCGALLARAGESVAVAESCTAGMLAAALTDEPGSSAWFRGGLVVYGDELKVALAGVDAEMLARHGAVSAEVARELAAGARQRCGADWGIGITGIAGPGGGTACKPVGLVHLALAGPDGVEHWRTQQFGDRGLVRRRTVVAALDRLRRTLVARESCARGEPD